MYWTVNAEPVCIVHLSVSEYLSLSLSTYHPTYLPIYHQWAQCEYSPLTGRSTATIQIINLNPPQKMFFNFFVIDYHHHQWA